MVLPCLSAFNAGGAIFDNADGAGRVLTQDRAGIDPRRVSRVRVTFQLAEVAVPRKLFTVPTVAHHLGADLDQLVAQRRQ